MSDLKTYSRKDNLLRHYKKYHTESIASRIPPKKAKKSKPAKIEWVKRTVKT